MKIYFYILPFLLLSFMSCVNNDDEVIDPGVDVGELKPLTIDNLEGTWQIYYFKQKVNGRYEFRTVDFEGFTLTFFKDNSYYEANAQGRKIYEGTYQIAADLKSITLHSKSVPEKEDEEVKETIEIRKIEQFTSKRFVIKKLYTVSNGDAKFSLEDNSFFRNVNTIPDQYPNVSKFRLIPEKLLGTWRIKTHSVTRDGKPVIVDESQNPKGTQIQYSADNTYTEILRDGTYGNQGTYIIVDDAVHSFTTYKDKDEFKQGGASYLITEFFTTTVDGVKVDNYKVYESLYLLGKTGSIENLVTNQIFERVQ